MRERSRHISFERLTELAERRLAGDELAEARQHLTVCESCSQQATALGQLVALMRADDSVDAPRDALSEAIRMFRAERAAESEPGLLSRILATLNFDSRTLRPAFGVRSGQAAPARQMLFHAGDFDIDLRLAEGAAGWSVSGQVLGPCEGGGRIEVIKADAAGEMAASSDLNDLCEFTLPPVEAGLYVLRLRLSDVEVEIPRLELGA